MKKLGTVFLAFVFLFLAGFNKPLLAEENTPQKIRYFEYTIQRGDKLYHIARIFNTTKKALLEANSGNKYIKNENLILAGGTVTIPHLVSEKEFSKTISGQNKEFARLAAENKNLDATSRKRITMLIAAASVVGVFLLMILTGSERRRRKENTQAQTLLKELRSQLDLKTQQVNALSQNAKIILPASELLAKTQIELEAAQQKLALTEIQLASSQTELETTKNTLKETKTPNFLELKSQHEGVIKFPLRAHCPECDVRVGEKYALKHYFDEHKPHYIPEETLNG